MYLRKRNLDTKVEVVHMEVQSRREIDFTKHIVCADYGQVHLDARVVGQIINYTAETWQPDRPKKERECNIEQGKIAEEITERFIRQYYSQELSLKTYDEIRNDDFKKTCPV